MDKKEIAGRPINAEVAKPRVEQPKPAAAAAPAQGQTAAAPATGDAAPRGRGFVNF
jgi:hypothetical protein